ncbi:MAG: response regulator transcription factor [Bacteroidota bacterium]|nr:response regulator transcription factor [Bacteroidota bacterium]
MKSQKLNILIAEDHIIYREAIADIIKSSNIAEVVDEAENGQIAINMLEKKFYDIVFLDIEMPILSGIETAKIIKNKFNDSKIIILTSHQLSSKIIELIEMGVNAYILKNTDKEELITAINKVINGELYLSLEVYDLYAKHLVFGNSNTTHSKQNEILSAREIEIVKLICEQFTAPQIAEILHISEVTVHNHRARIMKKIQTKNVIGIVVYAVNNKIFSIN